MSANVILIGNDIHSPPDDMVAWQVGAIKQALQLENSKIVSIQSRKAHMPEDSRVVIGKSTGLFCRFRQFVRLFNVLRKYPLNNSRVWQFVGNGKGILTFFLALFCRLSGRTFLFTPVGIVSPPPNFKNVILGTYFLKETPSFKGNKIFFPPLVSLMPKNANKRYLPKLLFCSVPATAKEFSERGLNFLFDVMNDVPDLTLTVLNRYQHLAIPLAELRNQFPNASINIQTERIEHMEDFLAQYGIITVAFTKSWAAAPQLPLSILEGFSQGLPCIIPEWLALAEDVEKYQAGLLFRDKNSYLDALSQLKNKYQIFSDNASRLYLEKFHPHKTLQELRNCYQAVPGFSPLAGAQ